MNRLDHARFVVGLIEGGMLTSVLLLAANICRERRQQYLLPNVQNHFWEEHEMLLEATADFAEKIFLERKQA